VIKRPRDCVHALDFALATGGAIGDTSEGSREMHRKRQNAQLRRALPGEPSREVATRAAIQIEVQRR